MNKIKRTIGNTIQKVIDYGMGTSQKENRNEKINNSKCDIANIIEKAGSEGIILLKNENNTLPLKKTDKVSVFGRCQIDYFYVGYGSGGDVIAPHKINLIEGLKRNKINFDLDLYNKYYEFCTSENHKPYNGWWGHWPYFYEEMPVEDETIKYQSKNNNKAIIVIGRSAGEDRENKLEEGSYYLTKDEMRLLSQVTNNFDHTILILNIGNIIDFSFLNDYKIDSIILAYQTGEESGYSLSNILDGSINPSGKLTDTIAYNYLDYPSSKNFGNSEYNNYQEDIFVGYRYFETFCKDKVMYPFGYGLSYTEFNINTIKSKYDNNLKLEVEVKNIGSLKGKEVVQVYISCPIKNLSKASKSLIAFKKTKLLDVNESEIINFEIDPYTFSSYDENKSAYILESGNYKVYIGNNVRDSIEVFNFDILEDIILIKLSEQCKVEKDNAFDILTNTGFKKVNTKTKDLRNEILNNIPSNISMNEKLNINLNDILNKKYTMDEFISSLSLKDLSDLSKGEGMMGSRLGVRGNAGVYGGVTKELRDRGVPVIVTTDGPSGIRIKYTASLLPSGVSLASTWNPDLVYELYSDLSKEMKEKGSDVLLAPGMNIHRNPLCGRNFEYYSEDPYLTGMIGVSAVKGIQRYSLSACPKHFACNNQEVNRTYNDSRVSERALREIYLKGFEYVVKLAKPNNIMTSYNKINGVWAHYHYELVSNILRREWGYSGVVITDWWMRKAKSKEFKNINNNAYRVRSGINILMPGNLTYANRRYTFDKMILKSIGKKDGITLGELQENARYVLNLCLLKLEKEKEKLE